jgi:hypothetical protein
VLLVAAGISNEGYTNTSEIIDLKKNYDLWNEPKQLLTMLDTPLAGYLDESTSLLCGISILKILLYLTRIIFKCCFNNCGS